MRSVSVQIIAVIGIIFVLVPAGKFWNTEAPGLPSLPALPSLPKLSVPRPAHQDISTSCPIATDGDLPTDARPTWVIPPRQKPDDYPLAALQAGLSGTALVQCDAMPDGRIVNCQIVQEVPTGYGFGDSAMGIVQRGCLTPFSPEQEPVNFTVRVPFNLG